MVTTSLLNSLPVTGSVIPLGVKDVNGLLSSGFLKKLFPFCFFYLSSRIILEFGVQLGVDPVDKPGFG
ncbi:hypothetical protein BTH50_05590 [Lactobacillus delbrueckii subsp. bulgaricus]|nr:hypothetical protein [Lactobacillus delbrueckii subsp. bulgaricus]MBT8851041.1 hypothetical protein [Lactobacillus delbrueckii subsp. bulgaricus]